MSTSPEWFFEVIEQVDNVALILRGPAGAAACFNVPKDSVRAEVLRLFALSIQSTSQPTSVDKAPENRQSILPQLPQMRLMTDDRQRELYAIWPDEWERFIAEFMAWSDKP